MKKQKPYTKDFNTWNTYKQKLDSLQTPIYSTRRKNYLYKAGEIWFCSVGVNIGVEVCGKNNHFERPVLVLKKSGRNFIGVPLTSKKPKRLHFYHDISFVDDTGNRKSSFVSITQPRAYDVNRLRRKIRRINDKDFSLIREKVTSFIVQ